MNRLPSAGLVLALMLPALSGCLSALASPPEERGPCDNPGQSGDQAPQCRDEEFPCVHPYPCGDEWPDGLEGPFALREIQRVKVESHDGTLLDGWVFLPDLPEGVGAPSILISIPYWGTRPLRHGDGAPAGNLPTNEEVRGLNATPIDRFVEEGHAVAAFSVRGTGNSAGCFENKGLDESRDHYVLIEWLARQTWSNGRVGTYGLSYGGVTGLFAGMENPPSLKTVLAIGPLVDQYVGDTTPQGAADSFTAEYNTRNRGGVSAMPHVLGALDDPNFLLGQAEVYPERLCPEYATAFVNPNFGYAPIEDRGATFWAERNHMMRLHNMTAALWWVHGFQDINTGNQEDPVWPFLTGGPRRMLLGQWGHDTPPNATWVAEAVTWFDYWLKGTGSQPRLEVVDFQDSDANWQSSSAWPPAESHEEILFMADGRLTGIPGPAAASFVSVPRGVSGLELECGEPEAARPHRLLFASEPLSEDVLLAGNPFAFLRLESNLPVGLVSVELFDVPAWPSCDGATQLGHPGFLMGTADLRFYQGNYIAQDYPVGTPRNVRIDLPNLAESVPAGHRIVALVSYGRADHNYGPPPYPILTVHGGTADVASQIVIPVLQGTVGGVPPSTTFPPRPFLPDT